MFHFNSISSVLVKSLAIWPPEPGYASSSGCVGNWLKLGITERAECFTSGSRGDSHGEVIKGVTEKRYFFTSWLKRS